MRMFTAASAPRILFISLVIAAFAGPGAHAATRTWDGGGATENWSEAANWSGDTVPEVNDTAIFDGTSSKNCTIDINLPLGNSPNFMNLATGYSGTVTVAPNINIVIPLTLTVASGTLTLSNGSFTVGSFGGQFNLNGGTFNAGTGTANLRLLFQNGGIFSGSTGDVVLDGGVTINNGTFSASSGTNTFGTNAAQNFIQTGGIFNGNGTVDINGVFQLTGGTFNASPGNTSFGAGFVHTTGGTFNHQNGTVIFDNPDDRAATVTTNGNREIFNNVTFIPPTNNAEFAFANPTIFQVNGSLEILNGIVRSSFPSSPTTGLELRGNMTIGAGADGGSAAMRFAGTANQTITVNGGVIPTNTWTIAKTGGVVSLATDLTLGPTQLLDIASGEFSQGSSSNLTAGPVNVGAAGVWRNNGLGDITLAGNVTNAGRIDIDGATISCDEPNLILIRSSVGGTQRLWTGSGSFFIQDSDVSDQAGTAAITSFAGANTGNNGANWTFNAACSKFTWDGGGVTNNWTEAANWSRKVLPLNTLVVYFNATSSKDVVIDASLQVTGMRIETGYAGTISHLTPSTLLVVGSGTGTQGFVQNAGTYTAGRLQVFGETSILGGTFAGTTALKEILGDLTITNASFSNAGTTRVGGNLTVTSPSVYLPGPRVEFDGGTNTLVTLPANTQFNQLVIAKTSDVASVDIASGSGFAVTGSLELINGLINGDAVTVPGTLDINSGFDGGTGTVSVQNPSPGGSIGAGAVLPQSVIVNSPAATFTMPGAFAAQFTLQNGTVFANGGEFSGTFSQSGGTFEYGSASIFFNGNFSLTGGSFQRAPAASTTMELNGDVVLNGGTFGAPLSLFVRNDFRVNGAAFNHNNGTVSFVATTNTRVQVGTNQLVLRNVNFTSASVTFLETLDGTSWITAEGNASFQTGGFERFPTSPAIPSFRANGNVTMTNFGFNTLLGLRFEGASNQTFTQTGGFNFNGWTIDKSGGTLNLAQDTIVDTLFLQNGTITTGTNTVNALNLSRTGGHVIGNLRQNFDAAGAKTFHVGTANGYSPVTVNATAAAFGSALTVSATQSLRAGMNASASAVRFWTLTETGDLTVDVIFNYLQTDVSGDESTYKLFKWNGTSPTLIASTPDTVANTLSATGISDFSEWAIGNLAPSAANVALGGRATQLTGQGVAGARVTLTDSNGNVRIALTNPFGYYRFTELPAGHNYVVSVTHKWHQFIDPNRIIFADESIGDIDFIAAPE